MTLAYTLQELAERFSVVMCGDPSCRIERVASLETAETGCITFLANARYKHLLKHTRASAVILAPEHAEQCPVPVLITDNPYALYAQISALLNPPDEHIWTDLVHASAIIHVDCAIHPSVQIGPHCVIEAGVEIGEACRIGPGCIIQRDSCVGAGSYLVANVTVCKASCIGTRAVIHPGTVVGSDGFGFANEKGQWIKVPQIGGVVIGDDVEIGACVTIDRGSNRDTVIENGVKLDNLIHIAHNVRVGAHTAMAAMTGVAGSSTIGQYCTIGGRVSILGHLTIPDRTHINACSIVAQSIETPGSYSSGTPLEPSASWRRNWVRFKQLDEMAKRIRVLENTLSNLDLLRGDDL